MHTQRKRKGWVGLTSLRLAWGLALTRYYEPEQLQMYWDERSERPVWTCMQVGTGMEHHPSPYLELQCSVWETIDQWIGRLQTVLDADSLDEVFMGSPKRYSPAWREELEQIARDDARWNAHLHHARAAERLLSHVVVLENALLRERDRRLGEAPMLLDEEYEQIVRVFNQTTMAYPRNRTIDSLFSERAAAQAGRDAVVYGTGSITYGELERESSRLAAALRREGVGRGQVIAVMADRTPEMIIALLAIFKTGAAYVPIDPRAPEVHNRMIREDCGAHLVLSQSLVQEWLHAIPYAATAYPNVTRSESAMDSDSQRLAYILYTSGTTGTPKGVMVRHRNVVHYASWFNSHYGMEAGLRVLLGANLTFDASVESIFCTLLGGGTVVLIPTELLVHPRAFRTYIDRHQVQLLHLVPTLLDRLLTGVERLTSLRTVISGGEALDERLKDALLRKGYQVFNHYGPTETTVVAISGAMREGQPVTLGRPIDNTRVYIVNSLMQPCPIGVTGEICIAGEGLSAGYLQRDELMKQRFVPNPFEPGMLLYRTGDFGYWLPEGLVAYEGRIDDQLKINGILVHLEMIRTAVVAHPAIQGAVVTPSDGDLVVYYRLESVGLISAAELRAHLLQLLPAAIIPKQFVEMRQFPLNMSGKIDKRRLIASEAHQAH